MMVITVSQLVEICAAIEGDEQAKEKAATTPIVIVPPFSRKLSSVIMHISDTEKRRWALDIINPKGSEGVSK